MALTFSTWVQFKNYFVFSEAEAGKNSKLQTKNFFPEQQSRSDQSATAGLNLSDVHGKSADLRITAAQSTDSENLFESLNEQDKGIQIL